MAIRRCPYCKAIIDEGSEYCSNCGTQLIFPEDEFVDEEIPGEKIIDVNEEDSESEEEQNPAEGKGQSSKGKRGRKKAAGVSKKADEKVTEEEAEEVAVQNESADFRTEDLEGMVDPAEKEKEEIEKFLDSLKEERERTKKYYEETGELPPWAQSMREGQAQEAHFEEEEEFGEEPIDPEEGKEIEDIEDAGAYEESFEKEKIEEPAEPQTPPEAEKGIPFEEAVTEEEEAVRAADTGMGLPEGVDQQNLPFSRGIFESASGREKKRRTKRSDMSFSPWIKSRIFDVLIIAGIWLVGLWVASRVVEIGFFQLLTTSTVQTLLFLAILLVIYFFLFLFFLGETLGDHLFSEEP